MPESPLGLGEGTSLKVLKALNLRGWLLVGTAVCGVVLAGAVATFGSSARAGGALEERKLPMKFNWIACEPNCRGWVSAVGIITADTPKDFEEFSRGRQIGGATVVLDSSGGSVNDAITLGRRFRNLGLLTTVGVSLRGAQSARPAVAPEAYCESMCVFLLLAGKKRYVPEAAHVRVHQIWMGDRADDAKAASYSAQDLMIVERDIGRLAKYTFDMGGAGDLLSLALSVPPWEDLHELDAGEPQAHQSRDDRSRGRRAAACGHLRAGDGGARPEDAGAVRRGTGAGFQVDQDCGSAGTDRRCCRASGCGNAEVGF